MSEVERAGSDKHFRKVELPFVGYVALGNSTQYRMIAIKDRQRLVVSIEERGSYSFEWFVHQNYAAEKLGIGPGDAGNVADWINDQLDLESSEERDIRQGYYYDELLLAEGEL